MAKRPIKIILNDTVAEKQQETKKPIKPTKQEQTKQETKIEAGQQKFLAITTTGCFIKFSFLQCKEEEKLKVVKKIQDHLTLSAKTHTGFVKQFRSYIADKKGQRVIIPRFSVQEIVSNKKFCLLGYTPKSQISEGEPPTKPYRWLAEQTQNQKIITEHIMKNIFNKEMIEKGQAGTIINLETGQGKTFLGVRLCYELQKKVAIILHSKSIVSQWVTALQTCLGADTSIGFYYGGKHTLADIMIMVIDSSLHDEFTFKNMEPIPHLQFWKRFGLIIYDECHSHANDSGKKIMQRAQAQCVLGLSATPDEHRMRFDQMVWWHLGPVLQTKELPGYNVSDEKYEAVVHEIQYHGHPNYTKIILNETLGSVDNARTINMICVDPARNKLILNCILDGLKMGLNIFVFSDRREYLDALQKMLDKYVKQNGKTLDGIEEGSLVSEIMTTEDDFIRIVGGATDEELEHAETKARVIFTTYQYMGTGKSIVKMNGLVLATPRRSHIKQFVGRIFRKGSDAKIVRHIWDIRDMRLRLSGQWSARAKLYKERKYTLKRRQVSYEQLIDKIEECVELDDGKIHTSNDNSIEEETINDYEEVEGKEDDLSDDSDDLSDEIEGAHNELDGTANADGAEEGAAEEGADIIKEGQMKKKGRPKKDKLDKFAELFDI